MSRRRNDARSANRSLQSAQQPVVSAHEIDAALFGEIRGIDERRAEAIDPAEIAALQDELQRLTDERDEALAVLESGGIVNVGRCNLTATGLLMPDDLSRDEWLQIGSNLNAIEGALQWMIGDWAVRGEDNTDLWLEGSQSDKAQRHERYAALVEETGYSHKSIKNLASTARNIPYDERRAGVGYSKHAEVASLPVAKMRALLDYAEANPECSVREFRQKVKDVKGVKPRELPLLVVDQRHKRLGAIVGAIKANKAISRDDIKAVREWLEEVEKTLS